jgi:hypothetical protein
MYAGAPYCPVCHHTVHNNGNQINGLVPFLSPDCLVMASDYSVRQSDRWALGSRVEVADGGVIRLSSEGARTIR